MLAEQSPASFVAWDLLALGDEDLRGAPQGERRARLEAALGPARRRPSTSRPRPPTAALAADWFDRFEGAGLDGVVAKRLDGPYQPGKRAMLKVKHQRTADCVVAGFRWHKNGPGTHVGSLLLGLFDDDGTLHHVGVTSSFTWDARAALAGGARAAARRRARGPPVGGLGRVGRRGRPTHRASACPARPAAGTAARTCPGSRSGSSASPRSPTTTCRATGSATPRRSSAGAPTSRRRTAATTSSRRPRPTSWRTSSGA